jgi:pimeloyl-ACP methyl ester carboxylesterase
VIRDVVLVPGLWVPALSMALVAARLAREGFAPRLFGYAGRDAFEANVEQLVEFSRGALQGRPAHFVGHSLGGLLVLQTLNRHPEVPLGSAVLLGSPVRGCLAGRRLGRAGIGRWMMGACQGLWEEKDIAWHRQEPLGVIAGTAPIGLGRVLGRLPGPNDGVVCVEETTVRGMAARALVPVGHSPLVVSSRVSRLIAQFMRYGRFE